jgi:DNA-binding MarR family transcriptional regulator
MSVARLLMARAEMPFSHPVLNGPDGDLFVGHLMRRCQQISTAIMIHELEEFDLTPPMWASLSALHQFGVQDQIGLAGIVALDRTTIMVVLKNLVRHGLIKRSPSETDRRANMVCLSDAGQKMIALALPNVRSSQQKLVEPLTRREQSQLMGLLGKIAEKNNDLSKSPMRVKKSLGHSTDGVTSKFGERK